MTDVSERISELRRELAANQASRQFYQLGELLRREGETTEAMTVLRQGLRHHPRYVAAWVSLGRACLDVSDGQAAAGALKEALGLDSQNPVAWRLLGEARLSIGDREGALDAIEHAMVLAPGDDVLVSAAAELRAQLAARDARPREAGGPAVAAQPAVPAEPEFVPPPRAVGQAVEEDPFSAGLPAPEMGGDDVFAAWPEVATTAPETPPGEAVVAPPVMPVAEAPEPALSGDRPSAEAEAVSAPDGETESGGEAGAATTLDDVPFFFGTSEEPLDLGFLEQPKEDRGPEATMAPTEPESVGPAARVSPETSAVGAGPAPEAHASPVRVAADHVAAAEVEAVSGPEPEAVVEPEPEPATEPESEPVAEPAPEAEAAGPLHAEPARDRPEEAAVAPRVVRPTITLARLYIQQQDLHTAERVLEQVLEAERDNQEAADLLDLVRDMMAPLPETVPQLSVKERRIAELQRWAAALALGRERLQR